MPCHRGLLVDPRLGILNAKRNLVTRPDSRSSSGWFLPLSQSAHHRDHFDCVRRLVRIPLGIRRIRLALQRHRNLVEAYPTVLHCVMDRLDD